MAEPCGGNTISENIRKIAKQTRVCFNLYMTVMHNVPMAGEHFVPTSKPIGCN